MTAVDIAHAARPRPHQQRQQSDPQPWFPWVAHTHNPRPAPPTPTAGTSPAVAPVAWGTQCRDCWGFLDDPRHLVATDS